VFLFVAVGAIIRLRSRGSILFGAIAAISIGLSLLAYEALVVCALALPLFGLLAPPNERWRAFARCAVPSVIAIGAYTVFFLLSIPGNPQAYHFGLSKGTAYTEPVKALGVLYHTTYFYPPWKFAAVLCVASALAGPLVIDGRWRLAAIALAAGFALAPLFSLPYAVNFYFLGDPERVGLTTGFAFFMLCTAIAILAARPIGFPLATASVAILLLAAAINGYRSYQPYLLQRAVIDQAQDIARQHPAPGYIVRDWTGRYGDLHTFLASATLQQAITASGMTIEAQMCTPRGVARSHPVLERVPSASPMAWCDENLTVPAGSMVLDIKPASNPEAHPVVELAN
jgi:hypothetical protein